MYILYINCFLCKGSLLPKNIWQQFSHIHPSILFQCYWWGYYMSFVPFGRKKSTHLNNKKWYNLRLGTAYPISLFALHFHSKKSPLFFTLDLLQRLRWWQGFLDVVDEGFAVSLFVWKSKCIKLTDIIMKMSTKGN